MTKWILAAGAAALAITSPALADPGGQGGGKGGGKGGQQSAKADKGGGGNGRSAKSDRGGGHHAAKADRGGEIKQSHAVRLSGSDDRGKNRGNAKARDRDNDRVVVRSRDFDDRRIVRVDGDDRFDRRSGQQRLDQRLPSGPCQEEQWLPASGPGEEAGRHPLAECLSAKLSPGVVP